MADYFQRRMLPISISLQKNNARVVQLRKNVALKADFEHVSIASKEYEFQFLNVIAEFADSEVD